ncbi:MAG: radical SAM protein, partial [Phycisphaerales bacterium JB038]
EVTVHDTLKMKEHLPLIREAGCRGLWMGVEDLTATLVKKGQNVDNTIEAFHRLREVGICPMPMMMHHDAQTLYSQGSSYGLLNQVEILRRAGAVSLQVLMIVPSPGSTLYEETYTCGQVFESAGGRRVEPYMHDGNYVIASHHPHPWRKQLNILSAYLYFYNPWWLLMSLLRNRQSKTRDRQLGMQIVGMLGVTQNLRRTLGWALRLKFGRKVRRTAPPASTIPLRHLREERSSSDLPLATITMEGVQLGPRVAAPDAKATG